MPLSGMPVSIMIAAEYKRKKSKKQTEKERRKDAALRENKLRMIAREENPELENKVSKFISKPQGLFTGQGFEGVDKSKIDEIEQKLNASGIATKRFEYTDKSDDQFRHYRVQAYKPKGYLKQPKISQSRFRITPKRPKIGR